MRFADIFTTSNALNNIPINVLTAASDIWLTVVEVDGWKQSRTGVPKPVHSAKEIINYL